MLWEWEGHTTLIKTVPRIVLVKVTRSRSKLFQSLRTLAGERTFSPFGDAAVEV